MSKRKKKKRKAGPQPQPKPKHSAEKKELQKLKSKVGKARTRIPQLQKEYEKIESYKTDPGWDWEYWDHPDKKKMLKNQAQMLEQIETDRNTIANLQPEIERLLDETD